MATTINGKLAITGKSVWFITGYTTGSRRHTGDPVRAAHLIVSDRVPESATQSSSW